MRVVQQQVTASLALAAYEGAVGRADDCADIAEGLVPSFRLHAARPSAEVHPALDRVKGKQTRQPALFAAHAVNQAIRPPGQSRDAVLPQGLAKTLYQCGFGVKAEQIAVGRTGEKAAVVQFYCGVDGGEAPSPHYGWQSGIEGLEDACAGIQFEDATHVVARC